MYFCCGSLCFMFKGLFLCCSQFLYASYIPRGRGGGRRYSEIFTIRAPAFTLYPKKYQEVLAYPQKYLKLLKNTKITLFPTLNTKKYSVFIGPPQKISTKMPTLKIFIFFSENPKKKPNRNSKLDPPKIVPVYV